MMEGDSLESIEKEREKYRIKVPEAYFLEDVDKYMLLPENNENVELVLRKLENQRNQYQFMEASLLTKKRRLKVQIPDLENSLKIIQTLQKEQSVESEMETQFLLSDMVYVKAIVPPTKKVCLWLGANVMLEYSLEDAISTLSKNIGSAKLQLECIDEDLVFLRDQFTTTEVNMARVFNWEVKKRQAAKE